MFRKITTYILLAALTVGGVLAIMSTNVNADCVETADIKCCGGIETTLISCSSSGGQTSNIEDSAVWQVVIIIFNIVSGIVGVVAVGGLVWGALKYATAQDNSSQVQEAIGTIRNVVIGVVMYVAMFSALQYLIPGGIFNP